jgi:phosphate/phosphite/phosphonate ABC transporter binding protein
MPSSHVRYPHHTGLRALSGRDRRGRNPDQLTVTQITAENPTSLKEARGSLTALLEKQTGKKIVFQDATSYAAVIKAMRAGKADVGFFGPDSYVTAKDTGVSLDVVAAAVVTKTGPATYQSYGIVKADSPIKSRKDCRGKKVCFAGPDSTSGYLYPQAGLKDAGVNTDKDIKTRPDVLPQQHDRGTHGAHQWTRCTGTTGPASTAFRVMPGNLRSRRRPDGQRWPPGVTVNVAGPAGRSTVYWRR